jgi:dolichyl-phosphate-mannose-protein mannosyltransferase
MSSPAVNRPSPLRRNPFLATAARFQESLDERVLVATALLGILVFGGWLRLSNSNWDSGQHLHPDERYITQVATSIKWPDSVGQYLDVHDSPLSPYRTEPGRSYLYGQLPLFAGKLFASAVGQDDYAHLNIAGRRLSALLDTGSIVLVFLLALVLFEDLGRRVAVGGALIAASLYAVTVAVIQSAHFFTMESWLVFFSLLTVLLAAHAVRGSIHANSRFRLIHVLIGMSLGLTVASKVSGALIAVPVLLGLLGETALITRRVGSLEGCLRACASVLTILCAGYVTFRAVSPYAFASSNWFDVRINPAFRDAVAQQRDLIAGKFLYPPAYQWLLSPRLWDPLKNLVTWQLGLPLGVAALAGLGAMSYAFLRPVTWLWRPGVRSELAPERQATLTLYVTVVSFVLVVFFYFGSSFAHMGRYLLPLVPFAVLAASYGMLLLWRWRPVGVAASVVVIAGTALYALAYHHIYTEPTTRVAATNWIAADVPRGTTVAIEHWDDSLPVGGLAQQYPGNVLPVFDSDDQTKLRKLYDGLSTADYYFLSSPRAWRTIGRLPNRFPIMVRYYRQLFAGRLGFVRVARFASEPELFGVQLHDIGAEEAFWVYDHPPVLVYRKEHALSWPEFRARLCSPPPAPPGCLG